MLEVNLAFWIKTSVLNNNSLISWKSTQMSLLFDIYVHFSTKKISSQNKDRLELILRFSEIDLPLHLWLVIVFHFQACSNFKTKWKKKYPFCVRVGYDTDTLQSLYFILVKQKQKIILYLKTSNNLFTYMSHWYLYLL